MKYYIVFLLLLASGVFFANHFSASRPADASLPPLIPAPVATAEATGTRAFAETDIAAPIATATSSTPISISAKSFISEEVDAAGNIHIIAARNPAARLPIASITKLMTAIVAVNNYDPAEEITIPQEAADTKGSSGKLLPGQIFFIGDILYPLLIESDNDAGIALSSKMEAGRFVELMNQEALDVGLGGTHYVNPTGLDPDDGSEPNYSSAADLAKLAITIAKNYPDILHILSLKEFDLKTAAGTLHHTLQTTNKLLGENHPFKILGGKTGETPRAKKNLVLLTPGSGENSYVVSVVLGSDDNFGDMEKLLEF